MKMVSVITGDLVQGRAHDRPSLLTLMKQALSLTEARYNGSKFEIFRGDGFQGRIQNPGESLEMAMYLRSLLLAGAGSLKTDARISIGIGYVEHPAESLGESDGEAFRLSGGGLDGMKGEERLRISSPWSSFDEEFYLHCRVIEHLTIGWSKEQAEAVRGMIDKRTQTSLSKELGISQSAVHGRIKSSAWPILKLIIERYMKEIAKFIHIT
ncbi:MAG: hypothetical protein JJU28_11000 [Cyclobacteriaceae bacterium]|nr:hypothetical protein [Cyclobacteriaceae bacterium]